MEKERELQRIREMEKKQTYSQPQQMQTQAHTPIQTRRSMSQREVKNKYTTNKQINRELQQVRRKRNLQH
jgi:hypothetical protein